MDAFTYTYGFNIKTDSVITTKMFVSIIDHLQGDFGAGYRFTPEAITEGGILFVDWPGRREGEYKTLRICLHGSGDWPWVSDLTLDEWRTGPEVVLWRIDRDLNRFLEGGTFLKAFYGAPCWTPVELRRFRDAFLAAGVKCLKKIPSAKKLRAVGELGRPLMREVPAEDEPPSKKNKLV